MRLRIRAELFDPQTLPPQGCCPVCGGELYHPPAPDELCAFCEKDREQEVGIRN